MDDLYQRFLAKAGPFRDLSRKTICDDQLALYGSYHLQGFTHTSPVQRNTLVRLDEFKCPENLVGKTVYDFGSHLGAMSFELARRGATVIGFEYSADRVNLCQELARRLRMEQQITFHQLDFNQILGSKSKYEWFREQYSGADIVICCALDRFINKTLRSKLYNLVNESTKEVCFFETNSRTRVSVFMNAMYDLGYKTMTHIGTSKSDKGYGRHSYILDKKKVLSDRTNKNDWNHTVYKLGDRVIIKYQSDEVWCSLKNMYERIRNIPGVPRMDFSHYLELRRPYYKKCLATSKISSVEKRILARKMVAFVKALNKAGVAHRDLHAENVYLHNGKMFVCDWEYATENSCPLWQSYDLTGQGLPSPLETRNMHVFHKYGKALHHYLNLEPEDFMEAH